MRRIDMHLHTSGSFDCEADPEAVFSRCLHLGLAPVFITDHDTVAEGIRLRARHPGKVVVGQEVSTTGGELIGLYLEETIPAGLTLEASIERIKEQGGLVYLEHPYDTRRRCLTSEAVESVAGAIDIAEVHNGRSRPEDNDRAVGLLRTLGVPAGAGSDAHALAEIGSVFVEVPDFGSPAELLAALRAGRVIRNPNRAMMAARKIVMSTIGRR